MQIDSKDEKKNKYQEEEWLREQYIKAEKTLQEIANELQSKLYNYGQKIIFQSITNYCERC